MALNQDAQVPVVNLNSPNACEELLSAAITYGFIFVEHTPDLCLTPDDVSQMFTLSKAFFASAPELKATCSINSNQSGKNHGWLSVGTETLDPQKQKRGDFKEAFNIGEFIDGKPQQPLASSLQSSQDKVRAFHDSCHRLCNQILGMLADALQIPKTNNGQNWFEARHDRNAGQSGSILRLLYYPKLAPDVAGLDSDIRAGAHSDYGSITLLFRLKGQAGLEIVTPEGHWAAVPVNPFPGASTDRLPILVNIGDLLSYWTNGLLKSTVHRVIFPPGPAMEERYSIAYFCHPEDNAKLVEIPSEMVKRHHSQGMSRDPSILTARDHLNSRLAATYGVSA